MKLKIISIIIALVLFASFAYADDAVKIVPNPAYDSDQLGCTVLVGGTGYTYSWYKNGALTGISGAYVQPQFTLPSETWRCVVSKFYPGGVGWITIGEDSVAILADENQTNQPPNVTINSPFNNSEFAYGQNIMFNGEAIDPEDGAIPDSRIIWFDWDTFKVLGYGRTIWISNLTLGNHTIVLYGYDSEDLFSYDIVTIEVTNETNLLPNVTILTPSDNSTFTNGTTILFNGTAIDPQDGALSGNSLRWLLDGTNLFNGTSFFYNGLSAGTHTIVLNATDSMGATAADSITITITSNGTNQTNQTNGTMIVSLDANPVSGIAPLNVTFNCSVTNGTAPFNYTWKILDPEQIIYYGSGYSINNSNNQLIFNLNKTGNWTANCTVTDSMNLTASDLAFVTVLQNGTNNTNNTNQAPEVDLVYPIDGAQFNDNQNIHFLANAQDNEQGVLGGTAIRWYSNGEFLNFGNEFYARLNNGTYNITVYAFDNQSLNDSESVTITVGPVQNNNNSIPDAAIVRPDNNANFPNGSLVTFEGFAVDDEDGTNLTLAWYDNGVYIRNARLFSLSNLTAGTHIITFNATDSDNATGTDSITITITAENANNSNPTITILSPHDNNIFGNGSYISFYAQASDPDEGTLTGDHIHWYDNGVNFANGTSRVTNGLGIGIHNITAVATDSDNATGTDSITITITGSNTTNLPPEVRILRPVNNSAFEYGTPITFEGYANDPEHGFAISQFEWYSDDELISNSILFTITDLSVGNHTITLIATDMDHLSAVASINIQITNTTQVNEYPNINITSPSNNSVYTIGDYVIFNAAASDPEDGTLTGSHIQWYDNGINFAEGTSKWMNNLSLGMHNITASATDNDGHIAYDSITIYINSQNGSNVPPIVYITAPMDGANYSESNLIVLVGYGYDPDQGTLPGDSLIWTDYNNGNQTYLGAGNTIQVSNLSIGNHTIMLYGVDNEWAAANDSIIIHILANNQTNLSNRTAPNVTIILPADNSNFTVNDTIQFLGSAVDANGSTVSNVQWVSDVDSIIGNSLSFSRQLSEGNHNITLVATDSYGLQGVDSVSISVINYTGNQTNQTSALVEIISPVDGAVYPYQYILVWINSSDYSDVTYRIDDGADIPYYDVPFFWYFENGNHTVTARNGNATDSVNFNVNYIPPEANAPVVRLFSPGDRAVIKSDAVDFMFNVSDDSKIWRCTVGVSGSGDTVLYAYLMSNVNQGLNTARIEGLPSGEHIWGVECEDVYGNISSSEKRYITIMTGNFTYYQPPLKPKTEKFGYELLIKNVEYDEYVEAGDLVPVQIELENTGDFDIEDLRLSVSIYDLDAYAQSTLDIENGKERSRTLYIDLPDYAEPGVYDIKIEAGNSKLKRTLYREITVI
jgi:hypothetical protein